MDGSTTRTPWNLGTKGAMPARRWTSYAARRLCRPPIGMILLPRASLVVVVVVVVAVLDALPDALVKRELRDALPVVRRGLEEVPAVVHQRREADALGRVPRHLVGRHAQRREQIFNLEDGGWGNVVARGVVVARRGAPRAAGPTRRGWSR